MRFQLDNASKSPLFANVCLDLDAVLSPVILAIMGPSGTGKSTLLKCIAGLDSFDYGTVKLDGKTPAEYGIPQWRSRVLYVPQRPPLQRISPLEYWDEITSFAAQKSRASKLRDPVEIAEQWNVPSSLWEKSFTELSGGEAQRIMLAIGVGTNPDLLLLDEPTSALDPTSTLLVEDMLKRQGSCLWVTHSEVQMQRVATHVLRLDKSALQSGSGSDSDGHGQDTGTTSWSGIGGGSSTVCYPVYRGADGLSSGGVPVGAGVTVSSAAQSFSSNGWRY
ncbi:P-loop containing nucleoside triphosphate hydrolase protein [Catenaria anguillulae PL171]|uniref:p-loop containing nucleoside triphosphate hydrolase protein n=1 Tax=Catenaria anguillulae PL171 TaxID=765915 RepID=A0A1Y2HEK7_9FUNG|nr:P-loop containing nucleoside triphosphate hydrolase protein [Catenaria anguillulae PL171]